MEEEHCLIQDDDGHWYVVPDAKIDDTLEYFAAVQDHWEKYREGPEPKEPEWLSVVGGSYTRVKFKAFRIE